jgi:transposase
MVNDGPEILPAGKVSISGTPAGVLVETESLGGSRDCYASGAREKKSRKMAKLQAYLHGIRFIMAAKILGEVGDASRLRSKGSFAMLTGTAPLEASSGRTKRHRLNRGGNRQLNYALHTMALARCRGDEDTKAYIARLHREGKSAKEAMRCLKRQLSNVVFRQLVTDLQPVEKAVYHFPFRP